MQILKVATEMALNNMENVLGHLLRSPTLASGNQLCRNVCTDVRIYMYDVSVALLAINIGNTLIAWQWRNE